jgi:hypothetical protein
MDEQDDGPEGDLDRAAGEAWAAVARAQLAAGKADAGARVAATDPSEKSLLHAAIEAGVAADVTLGASRALRDYAERLGFRVLRLKAQVKETRARQRGTTPGAGLASVDLGGVKLDDPTTWGVSVAEVRLAGRIAESRASCPACLALARLLVACAAAAGEPYCGHGRIELAEAIAIAAYSSPE